MKHAMHRIITSVLCAFCLTSPALAQDLDEIIQAKLRPGWRMANGIHMAALQLDLAPGWKTYWRQPGDSGLAPHFDFSQSEGVQTVEVIYPTPKISWLGGSRNIGYDTRVIFPLQLSLDNTADITLIGRIEIGVCRELCIPVTLDLSTQLSAQAPVDALIKAARAAVPKPGTGPITCMFSPAEDGMELKIILPAPERSFDHAAIELDNPRLWVNTPRLERQEGQLSVTANIMTPTGQPMAIGRDGVTTTLFAPSGAVEYHGCSAA
ncbi:protein-disulfide reductase DsbD domain-containing protein [uncultured Planktomarina sp.]|uniref:protein-disulfide reductase DsbD domain-containing protein n=1 Tax=uncultured Planktomarina sp. TaxID=1538529 RepID=UPI00326113C7